MTRLRRPAGSRVRPAHGAGASRVIQVISGTGMSTSFSIAEEEVAGLVGAAAMRHAA
jgi:hypothetical protein